VCPWGGDYKSGVREFMETFGQYMGPKQRVKEINAAELP
jgi:hypothetical protein